MTKLLTKGEYTTYIRKAIRNKFNREPNKTKLINELLEKYYETL